MKHYQSIIEKGKRAIDAAVSGHSEKSTRHVLLKMILDLRIFCNQGTFTPKDDENNEQPLDADEHLTLLEEKEEAFCGCCFSSVVLINQFADPTSGVLGDCSHLLCSLCYTEAAVESGPSLTYKCPVCSDMTEPRALHGAQNLGSEGRASKHSSKLNALIENLAGSQRSPIPEKR